jgi:outer membrane protein OmpA-like peptidoglycan-associated protein/tetratricopeptide (TPR) repeat protein
MKNRLKYKLVLFLSVIIFSAFSAISLNAQDENTARKLMDKAAVAFDEQNFEQSIQLLQSSIQKDTNFVEGYITLFQVYSKIKPNKKAVEIFEQIIKKDSEACMPYILKYAAALASIGKYEKAFDILSVYESKIPDDEQQDLKDLFTICNYAKQHPADPTILVTNAGDSINSSDAEYFPTITVQDSLFVFMRRDGYKREDFFYSTLSKDGFSFAKPLSDSLNIASKKGAPSLSSDLNTLYYAADYNEMGFGRYDIYKVNKTDSGWSMPINLGRNINTDFWESAPSISPDGQALFFSSNAPGGYGGIDIYVSFKNKNGAWGLAYNMGPNINTAGDDQTPFIHADNRTLYFSSNGWPGYGGTDIFVSYKKVDGRWSKPTNVGYPINTFNDEGSIAIASNGRDGYIASDREDTKGGLDIYKVVLPENARANKTYYFNGIITDANTHKAIPGIVRLSNPIDTTKFMLVNVDKDGLFVLAIPEFDSLGIQINSPQHEYISILLNKDSIIKLERTTQYFNLNPIQNKFTKDFKNVFFETNAAQLTPASNVELDALVNYLESSTTANILIEGHTDNTGKEADNIILSEKRAIAIAQYLIKKGIADNRISTKGFGSSKPIANNNTVAGRAQNRRTSFTITLP